MDYINLEVGTCSSIFLAFFSSIFFKKIPTSSWKIDLFARNLEAYTVGFLIFPPFSWPFFFEKFPPVGSGSTSERIEPDSNSSFQPTSSFHSASWTVQIANPTRSTHNSLFFGLETCNPQKQVVFKPLLMVKKILEKWMVGRLFYLFYFGGGATWQVQPSLLMVKKSW